MSQISIATIIALIKALAGGGSSITVDDALSDSSENPVQNKVIAKEVSDLKSAISQKQDAPSSTGTAGQVLGLDSNLDPVWVNQSGDGGGTTDYAQLSNKPTINNVELSGNKTLAALGINAGSVGFDETGTYADGSIGAEVSNQKNAIANGIERYTTPTENLWKPLWELGTLNTTDGTPESSTTIIRIADFINVEPDTTYAFYDARDWTKEQYKYALPGTVRS